LAASAALLAGGAPDGAVESVWRAAGADRVPPPVWASSDAPIPKTTDAAVMTIFLALVCGILISR
jgi:hypothetical protein